VVRGGGSCVKMRIFRECFFFELEMDGRRGDRLEVNRLSSVIVVFLLM